jgi:hypothetical protein
MLREPFKVTVPFRSAVGYLETNGNMGRKVYCAVGMDGIFVCMLFKGSTELPHSLYRAASVFAQLPNLSIAPSLTAVCSE